jgi:hypothetical protein
VVLKVGERSRTFLLYNNRLLQDENNRSTFYRCSEAFAKTVLSIRRG